jgi:2-C-methyl-D-erythritol 4-phosphate cytidylyltransferase / 2-C-methyl-D-erythritol 2,4-cyclodiphosphate synthase
MHVAAILAAGGLGTRIGGDVPKQFRDLGDGSSMVDWSLRVLMECDLIDEIVVALPPGPLVDVARVGAAKPVRAVAGGERRQDSVSNALAQVSDAADLIVIHDAARPFASVQLFESTIRAAHEHGAAIAAVPVIDTVKQIAPGTEGKVIRATLPRETIYLAQTPQAFRREVLTRAMEASPDIVATDEAMLVERAGLPVHIVEGDAQNIKVTTPVDLGRVQARVATTRVGTGYDLHRLVAGRPLTLAGVHIPFERGLAGHSDADIVCHAVTDAVLGAAAAGDIGRLFPDTDAAWKNAHSLKLLGRAMEVVRGAGYTVANVDVTVITERPKLLPYLEAMRANLASALGIDPTAVSIKGKTNEQVGEIGRGEAMACHAVALLITSPVGLHRPFRK